MPVETYIGGTMSDEQRREPERRSRAFLKWIVFRRRPVTASVELNRHQRDPVRPGITSTLHLSSVNRLLDGHQSLLMGSLTQLGQPLLLQ